MGVLGFFKTYILLPSRTVSDNAEYVHLIDILYIYSLLNFILFCCISCISFHIFTYDYLLTEISNRCSLLSSFNIVELP